VIKPAGLKVLGAGVGAGTYVAGLVGVGATYEFPDLTVATTDWPGV
jgi:hypothetical protein